MRRSLIALLLILLAFIGGCGGNDEVTREPPAGLHYRDGSIVYVVGEPIEPNTPTGSGGTATEYSVSPALPAGLLLNARTGVISGTPAAVSAAAIYIVTARNTAGSAAARLEIEVSGVAVAPAGLHYLDGSVIYVAKQAVVPNTPSSSGGEIRLYRVSPALPAGLALDARTGVISGTPGAVMPHKVYTVTGSNAAGSTSARLEIEISAQAVPPSGLVYATPAATYAAGQPIVVNAPHYAGGQITAFSISPTLPAGLSLDTRTGVISGTPATASPPTVYTISGRNAAGNATARLQIEVATVVVAPVGLHYLDASIAYVLQEPIVPNTPSSTGGLIARYAVSPALPAGLSLNAQTGVLSGMPTQLTPPTVYIVTASNSAGSAATRLEIEVTNTVMPPTGLHYLDTSVVYVANEAIVPNIPQYSGGEITRFSVSPALPTGLSMDAQTGVISGTPLAPTAQTTYLITVTGSNSAGSAHALLHIGVSAQVLPPEGLNYANASVVLTVGETVVSQAPQYSGGKITEFSVTPALPAGLSLDTLTGVISGTPTTVTHAKTYTVTGRNAAGSATARGQIEVKAAIAQPSGLHYLHSTVVYTAHEVITPNAPGSSGGAITRYVVSPALPAGLSLDTLSGVISGMPSSPTAQATYTITGTNAAGAAQAQINIEVAAQLMPPTSLAYSDRAPVYLIGRSIVANEPVSSGGEITHFSVSPPLPAGLSIDTLTGVISGTPTTALTPTLFTITGTNRVGSVSAHITIDVDHAVIGEWVPTDALNQWRYRHTTTLLADGRVLVAAGSPAQALSSAELYDPVAESWLQTGSLNQVRTRHSATLLPNGRVLVAGGITTGGVRSASAELYDPAMGVWSLTGDMNQPRNSHTATRLPNGMVLVVGGFNTSGSPQASAELYDPATGSWTLTGSLVEARTQHTATLLADGRVLVAGGAGIGGRLSSAELYDPTTGTWSLTGSMSVVRLLHTMIRLSSGQVLVTGGHSGSYLATAELYDPATGTWTPTGNMNVTRIFHTTTLLPSGKVLAAGGEDSEDILHSAELYDPATGTWALTGSLGWARSEHDAVLLPSGKVLAVGGGGSGASSELFH
ncbi:MAG TPA: putative Ig domain-containing protein [Chitinolyticbacter sp.]|nr:putative Ig domain-containing protein [Chitinolyticbacter sp.]